MLHIALPREDVVSLLGRAHARARFPDLEFIDPEAESVLEQVELDGKGIDDSQLRAAVLETMAVDRAVHGFFQRHPEGFAVSLHPGLCTRFSRVDNGMLHWVDLDPPGIAELKCRLYSTPDRHMVATCCSLTSRCWMEPMQEAAGMPVLLISQGALLRASAEDFDAFLLGASECFPAGTELLLRHDARRPLRPSSPDPQRACLEVAGQGGKVARYPRLRFVGAAEYGTPALPASGGIQMASRPSWRSVASVAHLRLA